MNTRAAPDAALVSSLAILAALLAIFSWQTWPDLLIDFGREAYVAWRLGEGEILYRDLAYLNGPLSPYWNALVMRTSGLGLAALYLSNALVLAALIVLLQRGLTALADRWSAWAATACFLLVFGFARYSFTGNYAYLAPYSHEASHGLLLSIGALVCVARAAAARAQGAGATQRWSAAAGLLLGAVALTKVELLVALVPAVVVGLALTARVGRQGAPRLDGRALLIALGSALLVPLLAWSLLIVATPLDAREALGGILGGLAWALDPRLTGLSFYTWGSGLDDAAGNSLRLLNSVGLQLALLAPGLGVSLLLRGRRAAIAAAAAGALALASLLVFREQIDWLAAARPLPLYMLALLAWRGAPLLRKSAPPALRARALAELPSIVFAGLLLAKLGLNARVYHYGFVLAMPATLIVVLALLSWIPREIERRGRPGTPFRAWAAALLLVSVAAHVELGMRLTAKLRSPLGVGVDRILGDPLRGKPLRAALALLEQSVAADGTLLVLPEGVMLNHLTRRRTPTPYLNFTPFDLIVWGESSMRDALRASPPDAVLLVHRNTAEYGATFFGRDYGQSLYAWLVSGYRLERRFGDRPLRASARFGVELWLPRGAAATGPER